MTRDFCARPTLEVARDLLGLVLVHQVDGVSTSGMIVEVEAYIGETDPACHAAPGRTPRNLPLCGPPGFSYVYLNYGIHHLVVTVGSRPDEALCRGPGNLTLAMGITLEDNRTDLVGTRLFVPGEPGSSGIQPSRRRPAWLLVGERGAASDRWIMSVLDPGRPNGVLLLDRDEPDLRVLLLLRGRNCPRRQPFRSTVIARTLIDCLS